MRATHQKIVNELVEEYKKDPSTIAITLFGSLAREEGREDSDIDIQVFSESAEEWKLEKKEKEGITIDLVLCPKDHVLERIKKYPYLCYGYLDEKVLYDKEGFMAIVKTKVRKYFDMHPEVIAFWEEHLEVMRENKRKGRDLKNAIAIYDEAERLFSKDHKVTRTFFRD